MPTKIEWCEETWNPITGCTPISEGCTRCYAKRMAQRLKGRFGYPKDDPFKVTFHPDRFEQPLKWKKPRMVFVCSMGDLFHENVDPKIIRLILDIAYQASLKNHHKFLFLTKRPESMSYFIQEWLVGGICGAGPFCYEQHGGHSPPENFWLGVTAENQKRLNERWPILANIPAAKRFISIEPMLEPMDFDNSCGPEWCWREGLDWVIAGCETGPGARPAKVEWFEDLRNQCRAAGVPLFIKKVSPEIHLNWHGLYMPDHLHIQEYPK